jgi:hypothetical protein
MAMTARKLGIVLCIFGVLLGAVAIGSDLDDCTPTLCSNLQQEVSDFLAPAVEHTVGMALGRRVPAIPSRAPLPAGIDRLVWNGCGYDPPVPCFRGPPSA